MLSLFLQISSIAQAQEKLIEWYFILFDIIVLLQFELVQYIKVWYFLILQWSSINAEKNQIFKDRFKLPR